jgi:hypothetical protein
MTEENRHNIYDRIDAIADLDDYRWDCLRGDILDPLFCGKSKSDNYFTWKSKTTDYSASLTEVQGSKGIKPGDYLANDPKVLTAIHDIEILAPLLTEIEERFRSARRRLQRAVNEAAVERDAKYPELTMAIGDYVAHQSGKKRLSDRNLRSLGRKIRKLSS